MNKKVFGFALLALTVFLLALPVVANGDGGITICRKSVDQVACEAAAGVLLDACLADANGDAQLIRVCEIDYFETMLICDQIPSTCNTFPTGGDGNHGDDPRGDDDTNLP
ncbi:MAG: hypothetical protein AAGC60_05200 [Acidobacteriota bacterium]